MKFIPYSLTLILLLLIGVSCSSSKNTSQKTPVDMPFSIIKTGDLFGAGEEQLENGIVMAANTEKMNSVIIQMNSVNEEIKEPLIPDTHFFDESMLLFVFDKVRGSGGHSLEIIDIIKTKEMILVNIKEKAPNGPASTVMTQPYIVLSIEKSDLPIQLKIIEL